MAEPPGNVASARSEQPVYPIFLTNLAGAPVMVVGGGAVAARKVQGLLTVAAQVTVIAPALGDELTTLHAAGLVHWLARPYQMGDLASARLAFAATNDRAVNALVAQEAAAQRILCNVADDPTAGTFHLPAVHRQEGIVVAVGSGGESPRRAKALRDQIAQWLARWHGGG